ncbi:MAG: hypothetical protein IPJ81_03695 [Chitinophagaceae bacterium]|nr:hypothetical protein [Chitinophagaceae bacterium]
MNVLIDTMQKMYAIHKKYYDFILLKKRFAAQWLGDSSGKHGEGWCRALCRTCNG